eukprot:scaffold12304_cov121-Isochrysis_galbana.AAC.9
MCIQRHRGATHATGMQSAGAAATHVCTLREAARWLARLTAGIATEAVRGSGAKLWRLAGAAVHSAYGGRGRSEYTGGRTDRQGALGDYPARPQGS